MKPQENLTNTVKTHEFSLILWRKLPNYNYIYKLWGIKGIFRRIFRENIYKKLDEYEGTFSDKQ